MSDYKFLVYDARDELISSSILYGCSHLSNACQSGAYDLKAGQRVDIYEFFSKHPGDKGKTGLKLASIKVY